MTVPTRIVTSHFEDSSGAPVANEQFSYRRAPWSYQAGAVVLAGSIPDITDASGNASTLLWTNAEGMRPSRYTVTFPNGEQSRMFVLPAGTTPISLDELFALALEWGVPDIEDLFDARDAAIYGALANTADPLLGDNLVGSTLTNDGIERTVHEVLDLFDDEIEQHVALISDPDTPGHVDLNTIQSMIDVTHSSIGNSSTWIWKATPQSSDPGANSAGMNIDDAFSASILWLNRLGGGGTDYGGMIASLRSGDAIYIQQVTNVASWQRLQVTATPTASGSAFSIPITHLGNGPGGEPASNALLFVSFSPSVSGSGIPPVGGEVPDNSVSAIKIIDGSVGASELAPNSVTGPKIISNAIAPGFNFLLDPIHDRGVPPGLSVKGRPRYHNSQQMTIVDGPNKYGSGKLLRFSNGSSPQGGQYAYTDEGRVVAGDAIQVAAEASGTIGDKFKLNVRVFDSAGAVITDTISTADVTLDGTVQLWSIPALTILPNSYSILPWFSRSLGTSPLDIHAMNVSKGTFAPVSQGPELPELYQATRPQPDNLIDHPYNENWQVFPKSFHGKSRWLNPENAVMVPNDPANPFHGTTNRSLTGAATGIKIHRSEKYIKDNALVTVAIRVGSASIPALPTDGMGVTLKVRCIKADGITPAGDGLIITSNTVLFPTAEGICIAAIVIPPDCAEIWIWTVRIGIGLPVVDVYEWWAVPGALVGLRATRAPSTLVTENALLLSSHLHRLGENNLQNWRAVLAWMTSRLAGWRSTSWPTPSVPVQGSIAMTGDSWNARKNHYGALRDRLQSRYGNGGVGWMSATANGATANAYGWTQTKTGAWTDVDANIGGGVVDYTALGIELIHAVTTDITATLSWTLVGGQTANQIEIHYCKQLNGGTFRVQIPATGYSADIATANATKIPAKHVISGLPDAAYTINITIVAPGSAGVILHSAVALRTLQNGVVLHKLGNGSATSLDFVVHGAGVVGTDCIDVAYYQAQLALLNPTLLLHLIATNDRTQNDSGPVGRFSPALIRSNTETFFDTCRVAVPFLDLFLVSSADTGSGTVEMELYEQNLRYASVTKKAAFLSGVMIMSPNSANTARHLMSPASGAADTVTGDGADNSRHLTDIGVDLFAAEEEKMLML